MSASAVLGEMECLRRKQELLTPRSEKVFLGAGGRGGGGNETHRAVRICVPIL